MRSIRHDNLLDLLKSKISKLNLGQIVILLASILLTAWCFYNVHIIMVKFFDYDTIISLQNDPPNITAFPGITVCAPSIFKPQKLAELYPKFNESLNHFIKWRQENFWDSLYDSDPTAKAHHYKKLRVFESKALATYTASEILRQLSVRPEELLVDCWYHPVNVRNFQLARLENQNVVINARRCEEIMPILESIYEGKKCFTYFSALVDDENLQGSAPSDCGDSKEDCNNGSSENWPRTFNDLLENTEKEMVFDLNPSIELEIRALDEDSWVNYVTETILMTVHPPNILQNRRDFLFYSMSPSAKYDFAFTKKTTNLLEQPFKTKCVHYPIVELASRKEAKTRDHCVSLCIASSNTKNKANCANYYSVLTDSMFTDNMVNMTICEHSHQNYNSFLEMRANCESGCPNECTKTIFEIGGLMHFMEDSSCPFWYRPEEPDVDGTNSSVEAFVSQVEGSSTMQSWTRPFSPYKSVSKWNDHSARRSTVTTSSEYFSAVKSSRSAKSSPCNTKISIRIAPKSWTVVQHHQAITYESFLGTIGGHLGIWLGLSLYKIIQFAVHLLYKLMHKVLCTISPRCLNQEPTSGSSGPLGH